MSSSRFARTVVSINGAFSLLCGLVLVFAAQPVSAALFASSGVWQLPLLIFLGVSLIFFAIVLVLIASARQVTAKLINLIVLADVGWVLSSVILVLLFGAAFTGVGTAIILVVAVIISGFAYGQYSGARRIAVDEGVDWTGMGRGRLWGLIVASFGLVLSISIGGHGVASALSPVRVFPPGQVYDVGGQALHLVCKGEGGPTLVVDFGVTNWSLHWASVQDVIAKTTRICAYDRAGFGWSGAIQSPVSPQTLIANLDGVLTAAGEDGPFVVVGHSFGGYTARLYRDHYPGKVAGIVLVEAAHEDQWQRMPVEVGEMSDAAVRMMGLAKTISYAGGLKFMDIPLSDPVPTAEQRDLLAAAMQTTQYYDSAIQYFEAIPAIAAAVGETAPLDDLPLLVLSAGQSAQAYCGFQFGVDVPCEDTQAAWNALQGELAALSSDSTQITSPDARHYIQLDDPALVIGSLTAFVAQLR